MDLAVGNEAERISPLGVNPKSLEGQWVDVQNYGLGLVEAFEEELGWGQDRRHTIDFRDHGRQVVLLRRRKFLSWNDGLEFHIVPTPPLPSVEMQSTEISDAGTVDVAAASDTDSPSMGSHMRRYHKARSVRERTIDLHEPTWHSDTNSWNKEFMNSLNTLREERLRTFYEFRTEKVKSAWQANLTQRLVNHLDIASLRHEILNPSHPDFVSADNDVMERLALAKAAAKTRRFYWEEEEEEEEEKPPRYYWDEKPTKKESYAEWWVARGHADLLFIVQHPYFDWACLTVVFANSLAIAAEDPAHPEPLMVDVSFNIVFTVEMLVRLLALGRAGIWRDLWCRVDSIIVVLSWIVIVMEVYAADIVGSEISSIRAIRIVKILKTFKFLESLKDMIRCIFISLIRLRDVLLFVLFFIYGMAQVGMQLFCESLSFFVFSSSSVCSFF